MSYWKIEGYTIDGSEQSCSPTGFEPIPDNTFVNAKINHVETKFFEGEEYFSVEWEVLDDQYKGRRISQSLRVNDQDKKKQARAKNMLLRLFILNDRQPPKECPCLTDFVELYGNSLKLSIKIFKNEERSTNYVHCVYNNGEIEHRIEHAESKASATNKKHGDSKFADDDIPF